MKIPNLKPNLPSRKSTGTSSGRGGLKPPKFAVDLYADLRDRRLLPLVALLLVGIVAVPFLLSSSGEEESVPVAPPVGGAEASEASASFSVVPAEPGLRDPRKRLGYRQARDPFEQPTSGGAAETEAGGSEEAGATEVPAEAGSTEAPASTPEAPVVVTPESTKTKTETEVVVQHNVIDYTVDVDAGFVKKPPVPPKKLTEQPAYTQLPNEKNPIVVFMGVTPDDQRALFLMSNQVVAYYGDGRCALEQESCQLLELKPGQSATFAYGIEEKPFKVSLKKIERVVDTETGAASKTTTEESKGGSAGQK